MKTINYNNKRLNNLRDIHLDIENILEVTKDSTVYPKDAIYSIDIIYTLNKINRLAKKYQRMQEDYCNGLYDYENKLAMTKEKSMQNKIERLAQSIGCFATFQGDPRGLTVDIKTNFNRRISYWLF